MKEKKELLEEALHCWRGFSGYRRDRLRNKNYTFGNQWCDRLTVDGITMTEEEYIVREGNIPLKNNLIRRLVRNVVGVFADRYGELEKCWTREERERSRRQGMGELYRRSLEEFLISGLAVHRKRCEQCAGGFEAVTDLVSPDTFFLDRRARDPRGRDVRIVGQVHELDLEGYCRAFAKGREDCRRAEADYGVGATVRVAEVWKLEAAGTPGEKAWQRGEKWRYTYLDSRGRVLLEGDSPYAHRGHPYVFKCYPFLDGEIHSFVSDILDQQRYTNRLITLYDWVMRASAKGVLLFPEDSLPRDRSLGDIADEWSRFNGVIPYRPRPGQPVPMQVNSTSANSGISELLNIQLRMMEDVSGVHGALQGKTTGGTVSGTLYSQQKESSLTSLRDLLESYESFICEAVRLESAMAGNQK